ncbi:MAG: DNA polymerase III subunit beta [Clostridia bacterium]|nr:DNA polymerase III subunit beta [Clostridia bacterium]
MKIRFDKNKMLEKLTRAMSAVSKKNTHPFTEGVLLETVPEGLRISSYDMEKSVRAIVEAEVLIEGGCVINAQRFLNIIRVMPEDEVTLSVSEDMAASIRSGRSSFSLHALAAKDFPAMPNIATKESFTMSQGVLKKMLSATVHSIAKIDQRPILCGAFFKLAADSIKIVTCDSYTLSYCDLKTPILTMIENLERTSFIVPGRTIEELLKMLSDDEDAFLTIMVTQKNIIFNMENLVFSSRLVEGEYIDYDRLIPKEQPIEITLSSEAFRSALTRAALISEEKIAGMTKNFVKLSIKEKQLLVSSKSATGDVEEIIEIFEHKGGDLVLGFNCQYLMETMSVVSSDEIKMTFKGQTNSITIEPQDAENDAEYVYMILPLRMKEGN